MEGGAGVNKQYFYRTGDDDLKGPFKSVAAIHKEILTNSKECFDSSCNCLKQDPDTNWFENTQIFQLFSVVRPIVKAEIKLEEVQA